MFEITIQDHIAAAHFLRGYEGLCKNLHGHTWKIEITLLSASLDNIGMVADFITLKKKLKNFLMTLDHVCLNDLPYFKKHNPTTENLAQYVYREFSKMVVPLKIKQIRVWESDAASITYYE